MRTFPRFKHIAALAILFGFTGCLTIEENYTFKKNGSGTMEYVIDLTQLGEMMKNFGEKGEGQEKKDGDLGTMDMKEQVTALKAIPGIGKVKLDTKTEWIQRLSFSFKDITALNAALNVLLPDSTGATHSFFTWDGNTLVRTNNRHAYEIGASMAKGESEENSSTGSGEEEAENTAPSGMDMSTLLESMKYKYSFKFAQPLGALTTASGVIVEPHGAKEVAMSTDFGVISKDPKALDLRIPLQK